MHFAVVLVALAVLSVVLAGAAFSPTECQALLQKADPFIGSGGLGYSYGSINPGCSVPRGAMRLGPDSTETTANLAFQHFSGYFAPDDKIRMFSHTHFVGSGINGLGSLGLMPAELTSKKLALKEKGLALVDGKSATAYTAWRALAEWHSHFDKQSETAAPGTYSVFLDGPQTQVDLVATGGFSARHRYTFKGDPSRGHRRVVFLDVCHASHTEMELPLKKSNCKAAELTMSPDGSFDAKVHDGKNRYDIYLHGQVNALDAAGYAASSAELLACGNGADADKVDCQEGSSSDVSLESDNGVLLAQMTFGQHTAEVTIDVGMSYLSADHARANLQSSHAYQYQEGGSGSKSSSFTQAVDAVQEQWCSQLEYLDVDTGGDAHLERMLHSASYRTRLTPAIYSEHDGMYRGFDGKAHSVSDDRSQYGADVNATVADGRFYSDFSLWDTFRTQNPWLFLTDEPTYLGVLRSWGEITTQQVVFPKWTTGSEDNGCMMGLAGAAGALEAGLAGYGQADFDLKAIQQSLQYIATTAGAPKNARTDVEHYLAHGYVSKEDQDKGSSYTVTYAFDDYILAGISELVGNAADADSARARSHNWQTIFSKEHLIICPRASNSTGGEMACPEKPQEDFKHYTEGNALHWTYFVPHDIPGLISMYGSDTAAARATFESRLDEFFQKHITFQDTYGGLLPNPYFWAGNEPTMLTPYLFSYLGSASSCAKTQKWTRQALGMHFSDDSKGVPGNDDYGAMASWSLWGSLGLYPLAGTDTFFLTAPAVQKATVSMARLAPSSSGSARSTAKLAVLTHDNTADNVYIHRLLVDGQEHSSPFIKRSALVAGATLEFYMSAEPSTSLCA